MSNLTPPSTDPIRNLVSLFSKLPGVGEKSATRMVFDLLAKDAAYAHALSEGIRLLVDRIHTCVQCCNLTEGDLCSVCSNPERDATAICVVENVPDLLAIERTQAYQGTYHVLHGTLAPMAGITPDKLRFQELLKRIQKGGIQEVIVATNPTLEGESTAQYLRRLLLASPIRITRIASGIPMGGDLEYIDRATLARALQARRELEQ